MACKLVVYRMALIFLPFKWEYGIALLIPSYTEELNQPRSGLGLCLLLRKRKAKSEHEGRYDHAERVLGRNEDADDDHDLKG